MVARLVGYEGLIEWDNTKPDGTPKKQLNISRIKEIGWFPKINLDEGLKNTIQDKNTNYLGKSIFN